MRAPDRRVRTQSIPNNMYSTCCMMHRGQLELRFTPVHFTARKRALDSTCRRVSELCSGEQRRRHQTLTRQFLMISAKARLENSTKHAAGLLVLTTMIGLARNEASKTMDRPAVWTAHCACALRIDRSAGRHGRSSRALLSVRSWIACTISSLGRIHILRAFSLY